MVTTGIADEEQMDGLPRGLGMRKVSVRLSVCLSVRQTRVL